MYIHSFARRVLALVLTAAIAAAAALPGFAVYAMPIQTAYPQESIYLFDADTGEVLVEQNPDLPRCVASLTKMMTALLVIERGNDLNAEITIPDSLTPEFAAIKADRGHTIGLQAGETVRRIDMLYAMLLPSANDAASVLASDDAGGDLAAFAARMNARAAQLGCTSTQFTCAHGLYDTGNYSTARDMAKIALACYANPAYRQIADATAYELPATNVHPARNRDHHQQAPAARQRLLPQLRPRDEDRFHHPSGAVLRHLCPAGRPHLRPCDLGFQQPEHLPRGRRAVRLGLHQPGTPSGTGGNCPGTRKVHVVLVLAETAGMI